MPRDVPQAARLIGAGMDTGTSKTARADARLKKASSAGRRLKAALSATSGAPSILGVGNTIPRRVALHEAGHAIAFCYYGCGFDYITIYSKARTQKTGEQACCSASETFSRYLSRREITADERKALRKEAFSDIVISLAGCAAERRHRKISISAALSDYGQNDYEKALAVAAFIAEHDDDRSRLLDLSLKETARFVRIPVIWGAINGLADLVQKHRRITMSSRDVKAVVAPVLCLRNQDASAD
jgi:hypothetical protein